MINKNVLLTSGCGLVECESFRQNLMSKGFGEYNEELYILSLYEIAYLLEKNKIILFRGKKQIKLNILLKRRDFDFSTYLVYKDLKNKDLHIGSGLRFGSTFRAYEKGVRKELSKRAKEHSRWLVFVLDYSKKLSLSDFSSYNRVAHSTKKDVLLAIVDTEGNVNYYETTWKKNP